jgi:hypothetical protein
MVEVAGVSSSPVRRRQELARDGTDGSKKGKCYHPTMEGTNMDGAVTCTEAS